MNSMRRPNGLDSAGAGSGTDALLRRRSFSLLWPLRHAVEPVLFFSLLTMFMELSTVQQLIRRKVAAAAAGNESLVVAGVESPVAANSYTTGFEAGAADDSLSAATKWFGAYSGILSLLTLIVGLWFGSWADRFGRRRLMLVPAVGNALSTFNLITLATFERATPVWMVLLSAVVVGLTTGTFGTIVTCMALISDATPTAPVAGGTAAGGSGGGGGGGSSRSRSHDRRSSRIAVAEALMLFSGAVGLNAVAYLVPRVGLAAVFAFEFAIHVCVLGYIVVVLRDPAECGYLNLAPPRDAFDGAGQNQRSQIASQPLNKGAASPVGDGRDVVLGPSPTSSCLLPAPRLPLSPPMTMTASRTAALHPGERPDAVARGSRLASLLSVDHVVATWRTVLRSRRRPVLAEADVTGNCERVATDVLVPLLVVSSLVLSYASAALVLLSLTFVQSPPLSWSAADYSYWNGTLVALQGVSLAFVLPVVGLRWLRLSDATVGLIGSLSRLVGLAWLSASHRSWMVWVALPLLSTSDFAMPAMRSLLSKLVAADERSRVFAAVSTMQSFAFLSGSVVFLDVFTWSNRVLYPGFGFSLAAGLQLVPVVILLYVRRLLGKSALAANSRPSALPDSDGGTAPQPRPVTDVTDVHVIEGNTAVSEIS